jgi:uncharacterized damage-inducible protein DinB
MSGRPHSERLLKNLKEIRTELNGEIQRIKPEQWDWAPGPEMKTFRALLLEIGAMEKVCIHWVARREMLDWEEVQKSLGWQGTDPTAAIESLARVRSETIQYLERCTEEQLQTPVAVPGEWRQYWGEKIEPEEAFRWVAQHEYYHMGQIIIYLWIQGDNPYKREAR